VISAGLGGLLTRVCGWYCAGCFAPKFPSNFSTPCNQHGFPPLSSNDITYFDAGIRGSSLLLTGSRSLDRPCHVEDRMTALLLPPA
jgi:hypothetical protein